VTEEARTADAPNRNRKPKPRRTKARRAGKNNGLREKRNMCEKEQAHGKIHQRESKENEEETEIDAQRPETENP